MLVFQSHVNELQVRFFYWLFSLVCTFVCCYFYVQNLMYLVALPFLSTKNIVFEYDFISNVSETFLSYINLSFFITVFVNLPFLIYHLFKFLKTGLFFFEQIQLYFFFKYSIASVFLSGFFLYFFFWPLMLNFFVSFESLALSSKIFFTVKLEQRIQDYVQLIVSSGILFLICFQLPIICLFLLKNRFLTGSFLKQNRKIFIIIAVLIGAILSPPDIFSLLIIAIPLGLSFEVIIMLLQLQLSYTLFTSLHAESCSMVRGTRFRVVVRFKS